MALLEQAVGIKFCAGNYIQCKVGKWTQESKVLSESYAKLDGAKMGRAGHDGGGMKWQ